MNSSLFIQSREISATDILWIHGLILKNPNWSRYKLSREICQHWYWENGKGQMKDIACRSLLRKLDSLGHISLPKPKMVSPNRYRHGPVPVVEHDDSPIRCSLQELRPVRCVPVGSEGRGLFECFVSKYHYLSYRQPVGENLKYLIYDRYDRVLGCFLFGSAAWKCQVRDQFIGWSPNAHRRHLQYLTNNHRFLILPWVEVQNLASHALAMVCRRLSADWQQKYGHAIELVETFVQQDRFTGACYQAANWQKLGLTKGRSRNDRYTNLKVPIKVVYIYALHCQAKEVLCGEL